MENKFVKIKDKRYSYYVTGKGDAVIYIHGFGTPYAVADFYPYINALKENHTIVLLERLGYGNSDDGCEFDLSSVINHIIENEKLTNITLIGHSLGTLYALHYAKNNDTLKRLILLDSFPVGNLLLKFNYVLSVISAKAREAGKLNTMDDNRLLSMAHCPPDLPEDVREKTLELIRTKLYNESVRHEQALFRNTSKSIFKGMENINAKVLCICTKKTYNKNLAYQKIIPNCRVIKAENSSHFVHHDCFDLVLQMIYEEEK